MPTASGWTSTCPGPGSPGSGRSTTDMTPTLWVTAARTTAHDPQTAAAVSTISASLAACSSWVRALPSTVEEKPHCGDRHSCSIGT